MLAMHIGCQIYDMVRCWFYMRCVWRGQVGMAHGSSTYDLLVGSDPEVVYIVANYMYTTEVWELSGAICMQIVSVYERQLSHFNCDSNYRKMCG